MFFNSYEFIFSLLPISLFLYWSSCHFNLKKYANLILLIISIIFYINLTDIIGMIVILISIILNFSLYKIFENNTRYKKIFFIIGVLINIGMLGYFKYANFFIDNINTFFNFDMSITELIAPVGMSFFTFQQISFISDTYHNANTFHYKLVDYTTHILFFGYILSGPITRHDQIIKQFTDKDRKIFNYDSFSKGIITFTIGLFKKVIIADTLAKFADIGFGNIDNLNTTTAILTTLAYTLQIYFDFSGYSEMAYGIGNMFNLTLPVNFNLPYQSKSLIEFWKRWHITLTKFLTDYIYIPLGGNRKGQIRMYVNTILVFFISGLWHGANWTFIIWGCLHGILLGLNKYFRGQWDKLNDVLQWLITFSIINCLWILFRSDSIHEAIHFFTKLIACDFGAIDNTFNMCFIFPEFTKLLSIGHIYSSRYSIFTVFIFLLLILYILQEKNIINCVEEHLIKYLNLKHIVLFSVLFLWSIYSLGTIVSYIYVNF